MARVLKKEPRPQGCALTLAFGDVRRLALAASNSKGDVTLGIHDEQSAAYGVSGAERCAEFEPLRSDAYFSGTVVASNPQRIFVDAKYVGALSRLAADARAAERDCDKRFVVGEWWASAEWHELRDWVRAEILSESRDPNAKQLDARDNLMLQQLDELDSWATRRVAAGIDSMAEADAEGTGEGSIAAIRTELEKIYRVHSPAKAKQIPDLMAKYAGKEQELLASVREKYGSSPAKDEL